MTPTATFRHSGLIHIRDVLSVLVARDFKVRYKRSILGVAWSLLVPLAQFAVMYLVFETILGLGGNHYPSYLVTGILPWTWFQTSLMAAAMTIVENRELVKQVGFPVGVLPMVSVLSQLVHFLLAFPVLAIFLLSDGLHPSIHLLALPLVILVQFVFTASLAYIVATLQVTFRDTQYLLGIALLLFFYLTPVFWQTATIKEPLRSALMMNPISGLLASYRAILIDGAWPDMRALALVVLIACAILASGYRVFLRARDQFVEEL